MLNRLAFTELELGNNHNVMQSFARALAQSPGELLATVMLARAKLSQSDFTGAEEILKKACVAAPKSADAHRMLGEFYPAQNRIADTKTEFRQALAINPKSGPTLIDIAGLELAAGRKQQAEKGFNN